MLRVPTRVIGAAVTGVVAVAMIATSAGPANAAPDNLPGEPTLTLPINDSEAGGTYDQDFVRVYAGATPDGTPVYIYVPAGTPLDGSAPTGVASLDPAFDPNPDDEFVPCADASAADYTLTQAQIDYLGNELSSQIVAVDEEHYGAMDAADPTEPASDSLVMLVYNVQDANYYDCAESTYTAGYFAPDYIETSGMNAIVVDAFDWANRVGPADSEWNDDDPDNDQPTLYEGVIAHELEHLLHNYSDPGELSWVDEGLADFAVFLNGYDVGGSHLTYHQVFYADTSLTRWGGGLQNYGAAYTFFQYLWEQAGGNGDGTYTPDQQYDGAGGDLLIKLIFENPADGMDGVQAAIDQFNAQTGAGLRSAKVLYQDWAVAVYLDDEASDRFDIKAVDFGDPASTSWTIDIADDQFWEGRGSSQGAQPESKWLKRANAQSPVAVPYGLQVERFRNPGPNVTISLDGFTRRSHFASGCAPWLDPRSPQNWSSAMSNVQSVKAGSPKSTALMSKRSDASSSRYTAMAQSWNSSSALRRLLPVCALNASIAACTPSMPSAWFSKMSLISRSPPAPSYWRSGV